MDKNVLGKYKRIRAPYMDYFGSENLTDEEREYWKDYTVEVEVIECDISSTGWAISSKLLFEGLSVK